MTTGKLIGVKKGFSIIRFRRSTIVYCEDCGTVVCEYPQRINQRVKETELCYGCFKSVPLEYIHLKIKGLGCRRDDSTNDDSQSNGVTA